MRILADAHISPASVDFLRSLGHDAVRIGKVLSAEATDREIVEYAAREDRVILTQDLDFSAIIALSRRTTPSVISVRLGSARIETVNETLAVQLARLESEVSRGVLATVEGSRIRIRSLPIQF
jgi:predicted nuclease of predicted toxin-antitoxin system